MSKGCNLRTGDLLANGSVSGPADESRACMAEPASRGTGPVTLPGGEQRAWLLDGDKAISRARAERGASSRPASARAAARTLNP